MTIKKQNFVRGIILRPDDVALEGISGELKVALTGQKLQVYLNAAVREVLTADQAQTVTNKTINAPDNTITNIANTNISASAAIAESKLALDYSTSGLNTAISNVATDLSNHISDPTDAHDASAISNVPAGTIAATDVQAAINELDGDIQGHITDASDAHDASAISNVPSGNLAATDVQAALNELQGDIDTNATNLSNHLSDASDAHDASAISVVPTGNLAATDVQAALVELQGDADTAASHIAASTNVHGLSGGAAVVGTTSAQTLTNKTITGASIQTPTRLDVKQDTKANLTTYATTASNGQVVFATDTKELLQVLDGVLSPVGGGGIGGVDILFVQDFETAALSDFTQTGLSLSTSSPLHGDVSALLTHQNAVNQSFKQVIAVDRKFRGEAMTMRLNVKSNASAGNVTLNIYDETNAANLVASEQLQLANDTSGALNKIAFTIPETCASLSYTITALPEAGSPVTRVDDIIAELAVTSLLETSVEVPVITAWQGYTPTFQGFGTPTAIEFEWRQVGEDVEIRGKFVTGTTTVVEARVGLPAGLTSAGTSLIPSIQVAGHYGIATNSIVHGGFILSEPSVSYVTFGQVQAFSGQTGQALTKQNASSIAQSTNETISFTAKVPCAGLSATTTKTIDLTQSGLVQNPDSQTLSAGNAGQSLTANVTDIPFIPVSSIGSDIILSGSSFQVAETGIYNIEGSIRFSTSVSRAQYIYENGVAQDIIGYATTDVYPFGVSRRLEAGKTYSIRTTVNSTLVNDTALHYLKVSRSSSLKQVNVSSDQKIKIPTSELRMEGASSRGAVATAIVRFDTVAKLRGDAFTVTSNANDGTFITMTKAGKLTLNSSVLVGGTNTSFGFSKNQSTLTSAPTSVAGECLSIMLGSNNQFVASSAQVDVVIGDIIRVFSSQAIASNTANHLSLTFQEQDIAVSVTNVLPQFSESDLSVKGAGNAGQAITSNVTNIPFQTVEDTTGGNWNGSQFTVPETGLYSISASMYFTTSPNGVINLYKNGNFYKRVSQVATSSVHVAAGIVESFTQGEVISLRFEGTGTLSNVTNYHWISITKVGKPNVTGVDVTPFVNVPQPESQSFYQTGLTLLSTTGTIRFPLTGTTQNGQGIFSYNETTGAFTLLKRANISISAGLTPTTVGSIFSINLNGSEIGRSNTGSTANFRVVGNVNFAGNVGDSITISTAATIAQSAPSIAVLATALSDQILTAPETFSTDTAALSYAGSGTYTLSTLANAPVGTFITFIKGAASNGLSQTTTAPTQTTSDMAANGILSMLGITANSTTAGAPGAFAIQIGKGMKGIDVQAFKSAAKTTAGTATGTNTTPTCSGMNYSYNEKTGVLFWTTCNSTIGTISTWFVAFEDNTSVVNGTQVYFVINASKSPALAGVPLLQPRIATISYELPSGTNGGGITSGAYQTRPLNTLVDPTGIVTSLASNQVTLSKGTYYLEAQAQSRDCIVNKLKIRNITDSTDLLIGINESTNPERSSSFIRGSFTLTSTKTLELQQRCSLTRATDGMGTPATFGDVEVYTSITLEKIKD